MTCQTLDLEATRGDDFEHVYEFADGGLPTDISSYSGMLFQVRLESRRDVTEAPLINATVDFTQAADGIVVVTIPSATTATLDPATRYVYDAQLTGPVTTFVRGRFVVQPDVSRP